MNDNQIQAKWEEFKGGIRAIWGQISDEDLEKTKGNLGTISRLAQDKYGESKKSVKTKIDQLLASFDNETDRHPEDKGSSAYMRSPLFNENKEVYDSKEIFDEDKNERH